MSDEAERSQIEMALDKIAKEFRGINIALANKQEYAALSEILRAAIFAAHRAVEGSPLARRSAAPTDRQKAAREPSR